MEDNICCFIKRPWIRWLIAILDWFVFSVTFSIVWRIEWIMILDWVESISMNCWITVNKTCFASTNSLSWLGFCSINNRIFQVLQSCKTEIISSEEETGRCCEKNEKQQRSNCSLICLFFSFKYTQ